MNYTDAFGCVECFDTRTIDMGGAEIVCPFCVNAVTVKVTGLGWGLGQTGNLYRTATQYSNSTITFVGEPTAILADVVRVRREHESMARLIGAKGRNNISSGAIAIENRVRKALAS